MVDIQWSEPNPKAHGYRQDAALEMDAYGRLIPAVNRFPSAAGGRGFQRLADYVHSLGLRFGIHIMRGIPRQAVKANLPVLGGAVRAADIADVNSTCPWNSDMYGVDMSRPGAQAYYDSLLKLYAEWGVDYIKADDIARPAHREEIAALHRAIGKTGRPIVLSLSPGPAMVKDVEFLRENANMWRISDDFWDDWRLLRQNFILMSIWSAVGRPGAWPDADMLPLGRIGIRAERGEARTSHFTRDEQRTLISLWSIAQSPLMFGGDLPSNDEFTESLITNDEVLAVNQTGAHGGAFAEGGDSVIWAADAPGGCQVLRRFQRGRPRTHRHTGRLARARLAARVQPPRPLAAREHGRGSRRLHLPRSAARLRPLQADAGQVTWRRLSSLPSRFISASTGVPLSRYDRSTMAGRKRDRRPYPVFQLQSWEAFLSSSPSRPIRIGRSAGSATSAGRSTVRSLSICATSAWRRRHGRSRRSAFCASSSARRTSFWRGRRSGTTTSSGWP